MPTSARLETCTVLENREVAPGHFRMRLSAPPVAAVARPGQFVHVAMPAEHGHLLPRPLSLFGVDDRRGEVSLLFRVRGRGTEILGAAGPGRTFDALGPLGTGFPVPGHGSVLVAGGMGIAPLAFLASAVAGPGTLIYGARSAADLVCPDEDLDAPGLDLVLVTEDGSRGRRGTAVEVLESMLPVPTVFACGPRGMLAAVARACRDAAVEAFVSLEERMACGVGACLGCAVRTTHGYRRVCHDGPVFRSEEVIFDD